MSGGFSNFSRRVAVFETPWKGNWLQDARLSATRFKMSDLPPLVEGCGERGTRQANTDGARDAAGKRCRSRQTLSRGAGRGTRTWGTEVRGTGDEGRACRAHSLRRCARSARYPRETRSRRTDSHPGYEKGVGPKGRRLTLQSMCREALTRSTPRRPQRRASMRCPERWHRGCRRGAPRDPSCQTRGRRGW